MLNYTFAELLTIYFYLHQDVLQKKTQAELAAELQISRRTLTGWFAGDYTPRTAEIVERLAHALCLTAFQADLLLYAVNPAWVKYGTPAAVLAAAEVVRYREQDVAAPDTLRQAVPSVAQIEREWPIVFEDTFASNYQRWGVGTKNNGMCQLQRTMDDQRYTLTLHNQYHEDVFMGGDSNCFAPEIYYFTVQVSMVQGATDDDGYGLLFEAINDECYALLRIREKPRKASVVQTFAGGDQAQVYLRQASVPALRTGAVNQLAVLAIHTDHWFYVNGALIGHHVIARLPYSRLDVGIVAGSTQTVICHFHAFQVYAPPAIRLHPTLEKLSGRVLE